MFTLILTYLSTSYLVKKSAKSKMMDALWRKISFNILKQLFNLAEKYCLNFIQIITFFLF